MNKLKTVIHFIDKAIAIVVVVMVLIRLKCLIYSRNIETNA